MNKLPLISTLCIFIFYSCNYYKTSPDIKAERQAFTETINQPVQDEPRKELTQLVILQEKAALRSSPELKANNIIERANRGLTTNILHATNKKDTQGRFGFNKWYEINYNNQSLWVFGGLTSVAENGLFALPKIKIPKTKPYGIIKEMEVEKEVAQSLKTIYQTTFLKPDAIPDQINRHSLKERVKLSHALDKLAASLNHTIDQKSALVSDINVLNESIEQLDWAVLKRSIHNFKQTILILWANDLSLVLQNKQKWQQCFSYKFMHHYLAMHADDIAKYKVDLNKGYLEKIQPNL